MGSIQTATEANASQYEIEFKLPVLTENGVGCVRNSLLFAMSRAGRYGRLAPLRM